MKIINLLIILFLCSCATTDKNEKPIPKEVQGITNKDFIPKKEVSYNSKKDLVVIEDKELVKKNILAVESLDKANLFEDFKVQSPVDELSKACYEKEFKEAKEKIRELEESYRSNIVFWNQVATCFMLEGNSRKALLFYNKALEFNASYAPVLNNIGVMYERQGDDERALISYNKAASANKYARTPKYNMSLLYLKYGLYNKSIQTLNGLKRINPKDETVLNALAVSEFMSGNLKNAIESYSSINKDSFEKPSFGINYAYALFAAGKKSKAQDIFEDIEIEKQDRSYAYYTKVKSIIGVK